MKKRLISLLLAFSMMLTFLPAGAVSAFAEAGETIGEATIVPTTGPSDCNTGRRLDCFHYTTRNILPQWRLRSKNWC